MEYFVKTFKILYGTKSMPHNTQNLLHISQDVENMGILDNFSAFPVENKLQLVRKADKPLQQVIKRIYEIERNCQKRCSSLSNDFCPSSTIKNSISTIYGVALSKFQIENY